MAVAVCTACRSTMDCSQYTYTGHGAYGVVVGKVPTWHHSFAQPAGVDFLDDLPCEPAAELGQDFAVLPVTHTRAGAVVKDTLWLYYARGCSDMGWGVGRTLLAMNRQDLAVLLSQRLHPSMSRESASVHVAKLISQWHPRWAARLVRTANESRHRFVFKYFADLRARHAVTVHALVADAADGFVQQQRGGNYTRGHGCHLAGRHLIHRGGRATHAADPHVCN